MLNPRAAKRIAVIIVMAFFILGGFASSGFAAATEEASLIRLAGQDRYETALKIAEYAFEKRGDKFDSIILARGDDYADALSASYLSKLAECPIILVDKKNVKPAINAVVKMVKTNGKVYIVGGGKAVPTKVDTRLEAKNYTRIKRFEGADRYETNYYILKEGDSLYKKKNGGSVNPKILVCSGKNYPDALSCGATGYPILLTDGTMKSYQRSFINKRSDKKFYIIGGEGAVSKNTHAWFKNIAPTKRVAGKNRYATSAEVAKQFFPRSTSAVVVYGDNYPDGIAACSVAHLNNAPILLASSFNVADSYNHEVKAGVSKAFVIGGKSLVPDKVIALTNHRLAHGWNPIGKHFVFVGKDDLVAVSQFNSDGRTIYPTSGGAISPIQREGLIWPVESIITSYFGYRTGLPAWASKNHGGIDIAIKLGTPIRAAADGKVIAPTGWYGGYGNVVFLRHTGGTVTVYGHNSRNAVSRGDTVKKGDVIGYIGSTGNSTGPHLHFEVRIDNVQRDPLLYLPPNQFWKGY